jgi:hypothetical protein
MDGAIVTAEAAANPAVPAKAAAKPRKTRAASTRPTNGKGQFVKTGQQVAPAKAPASVRATVLDDAFTVEPPPPVPVAGADASPANPFRVWTAGPLMPHDRIVTPNGRLKVKGDYAYYLTSPEEVAWAKKALGTKFWPDNVPEGEPDERCETCDWRCRNYAAMNKHLNEAHGRPQNSGR